MMILIWIGFGVSCFVGGLGYFKLNIPLWIIGLLGQVIFFVASLSMNICHH